MMTGPVGIAYVPQRRAIIGMRSHNWHTCDMTPSHYRRVKPLSAHCVAAIGTRSPYRRSRPTE